MPHHNGVSGLGGWSGSKPKGCRLPLMYDRKISIQVQFDAHVCGVVGGSAKNSGRQYMPNLNSAGKGKSTTIRSSSEH